MIKYSLFESIVFFIVDMNNPLQVPPYPRPVSRVPAKHRPIVSAKLIRPEAANTGS